jgi:tetratricopeptide (TPR) repeat protein
VNPICEQALADLAACDAIDRNWPSVWVARARVRLLMAQQRQWRGLDPEPLLAQARAALVTAERLAPGDTAVRAIRADSCQVSAQWKLAHGGDPAGDLHALVELRESAAHANPGDPGTRRELGHCYRMRSKWAERIGEDRGPWLAKALEEFTAAVELNTKDDMAVNGRASALHERGRFRMRGGEGDAEADLRAAIRDYTTALQLAPGNGDRYSNRGYVRMDLARWLGARGGDAVPEMERAIADYRAALERLPDDGQVWSNLGSAQLELAETLAGRRADPTAALQAAEEALDAAIRINARDAGAYSHRGRLHLFAARRMRNAGPRMAQAQADNDAAVRLNPKDLRFRNARAVFHLTAAHMVRAGSGDPSPHYRSAMEDLEVMLAANPSYLFAHINHTNTCNSYGDWLREQGSDPLPWYAKAYASAKRAAALAPRRGDLAGTLALSAEKAGRLEEALGLYERALTLLNHPALRERRDALKQRLGK